MRTGRVINGSGIIYQTEEGRIIGDVSGNKNRSNLKLTLDGLTLVGRPGNSDPLINVGSGGEFIMKSGAIRSNKNGGSVIGSTDETLIAVLGR